MGEVERLRNWLLKNHPSILKRWEEAFVYLIDLDLYLEEYCGQIDQEYQAYLEQEE